MFTYLHVLYFCMSASNLSSRTTQFGSPNSSFSQPPAPLGITSPTLTSSSPISYLVLVLVVRLLQLDNDAPHSPSCLENFACLSADSPSNGPIQSASLFYAACPKCSSDLSLESSLDTAAHEGVLADYSLASTWFLVYQLAWCLPLRLAHSCADEKASDRMGLGPHQLPLAC